MKILITGGTGFIGSSLIEDLSRENHQITILTRKKSLKNLSSNVDFINNLDDKKFDFNVVINLCGEPISQRWTKNAAKKIYNSRIKLTKELSKKILKSDNPPHTFISGSAIGYYGTSDSKIFQENSRATKQKLFSQRVCKDWEFVAQKSAKKTRLIILRTAVVLGKNGGILSKLMLPFKMGLGGKIGSGKQPFSWIHLDDMVGAIKHLLNNQSAEGVFNLSAPKISDNLEFSQVLARNLNRPCLFSTPAFVMKLIYGKMADEILLNGQKTYPKNLLDSGYVFKFNEIHDAIRKSL